MSLDPLEAFRRMREAREAREQAPEASYCGRGICAALEGHEGTCAEASGWAE